MIPILSALFYNFHPHHLYTQEVITNFYYAVLYLDTYQLKFIACLACRAYLEFRVNLLSGFYVQKNIMLQNQD